MVTTAWGGARDAEITLCLIDAEAGLREADHEILVQAASMPGRKALVLNKVDRVRRETLLALAVEANELGSFEETFMISALRGDGCETLLQWLSATLPEGPWLYPEDEISDLPMRQLAAEITREKLFLRLHDELPYASHVETEAWQEREDGGVRIDQTIFVERDSQKKIVIGKGGATIKEVSTAARKELSELFERPVHLFLFVKVRQGWGDDPARYREMGLEFPHG